MNGQNAQNTNGLNTQNVNSHTQIKTQGKCRRYINLEHELSPHILAAIHKKLTGPLMVFLPKKPNRKLARKITRIYAKTHSINKTAQMCKCTKNTVKKYLKQEHNTNKNERRKK
jgi:hypothetical protein